MQLSSALRPEKVKKRWKEQGKTYKDLVPFTGCGRLLGGSED